MSTPTSADRRSTVVSALKAHPEGVSGEDLASLLGISRVAVGKHVAGLRELGYDVRAVVGQGYRLLGCPDKPLPYEVAPLLASSFWNHLVGGGTTSSTNDDCRELAEAGAPEGSVVLAAEQTSGRGRLGREWTSPRGGIYLSALFRPPLAPAEAGPLSLVVGLGVARGLEGLGAHVGLKWPNDVMVVSGSEDPIKVAGILLESMSEGERLAWVVAGVGVNIRCFDPECLACMDCATGRRVPLATAAAAVLDGIASVYERFLAEGFVGLADEYEERSILSGTDVTVSDVQGNVLASGKASGLDVSGRLLVETPAGVVPVASGDVTLRHSKSD